MNTLTNYISINKTSDKGSELPIESYVLTAKTRHVLKSPELNALDLTGFTPATCATEEAYRRCQLWAMTKRPNLIVPPVSVEFTNFKESVRRDEVQIEMAVPVSHHEEIPVISILPSTEDKKVEEENVDKQLVLFVDSGKKDIYSSDYYHCDLPSSKVDTIDEAHDILNICKTYSYKAVKISVYNHEVFRILVSNGISVYTERAFFRQSDETPGVWSEGNLKCFIWKEMCEVSFRRRGDRVQYVLTQLEEGFPAFSYSFIPQDDQQGVSYLPCSNCQYGLCVVSNTSIMTTISDTLIMRFRNRCVQSKKYHFAHNMIKKNVKITTSEGLLGPGKYCSDKLFCREVTTIPMKGILQEEGFLDFRSNKILEIDNSQEQSKDPVQLDADAEEWKGLFDFATKERNRRRYSGLVRSIERERMIVLPPMPLNVPYAHFPLIPINYDENDLRRRGDHQQEET